MQQYDVLIVGGGPSGSTLAYDLKNSGLTVAVLDKQSFPRQKNLCRLGNTGSDACVKY